MQKATGVRLALSRTGVLHTAAAVASAAATTVSLQFDLDTHRTAKPPLPLGEEFRDLDPATIPIAEVPVVFNKVLRFLSDKKDAPHRRSKTASSARQDLEDEGDSQDIASSSLEESAVPKTPSPGAAMVLPEFVLSGFLKRLVGGVRDGSVHVVDAALLLSVPWPTAMFQDQRELHAALSARIVFPAPAGVASDGVSHTPLTCDTLDVDQLAIVASSLSKLNSNNTGRSSSQGTSLIPAPVLEALSRRLTPTEDNAARPPLKAKTLRAFSLILQRLTPKRCSRRLSSAMLLSIEANLARMDLVSKLRALLFAQGRAQFYDTDAQHHVTMRICEDLLSSMQTSIVEHANKIGRVKEDGFEQFCIDATGMQPKFISIVMYTAAMHIRDLERRHAKSEDADLPLIHPDFIRHFVIPNVKQANPADSFNLMVTLGKLHGHLATQSVADALIKRSTRRYNRASTLLDSIATLELLSRHPHLLHGAVALTPFLRQFFKSFDSRFHHLNPEQLGRLSACLPAVVYAVGKQPGAPIRQKLETCVSKIAQLFTFRLEAKTLRFPEAQQLLVACRDLRLLPGDKHAEAFRNAMRPYGTPEARAEYQHAVHPRIRAMLRRMEALNQSYFVFDTPPPRGVLQPLTVALQRSSVADVVKACNLLVSEGEIAARIQLAAANEADASSEGTVKPVAEGGRDAFASASGFHVCAELQKLVADALENSLAARLGASAVQGATAEDASRFRDRCVVALFAETPAGNSQMVANAAAAEDKQPAEEVLMNLLSSDVALRAALEGLIADVQRCPVSTIRHSPFLIEVMLNMAEHLDSATADTSKEESALVQTLSKMLVESGRRRATTQTSL